MNPVSVRNWQDSVLTTRIYCVEYTLYLIKEFVHDVYCAFRLVANHDHHLYVGHDHSVFDLFAICWQKIGITVDYLYNPD